MSQTPVSLLDRLSSRPDADSWLRLVDLYTPLIHTWLRRYSVLEQDAEDLVQEVLQVVVRELPRFCHTGQPGSFRNWLRTVTVHRLRGFWRARRSHPLVPADSDFEEVLDQLEDPASALSQVWNHQHDRHVLQRLLEFIEPEFEPKTWQAFRRLLFDGRKAADVAAELGMSAHAAIVAKSRVLKRLRRRPVG